VPFTTNGAGASAAICYGAFGGIGSDTYWRISPWHSRWLADGF
jgi:hypothetical protein